MSKTVRIKFKDAEGKKFSLSMNHASGALEEEGGSVIAQAAVDTLLEKQPLERKVAECIGVDVVERNVKEII